MNNENDVVYITHEMIKKIDCEKALSFDNCQKYRSFYVKAKVMGQLLAENIAVRTTDTEIVLISDKPMYLADTPCDYDPLPDGHTFIQDGNKYIHHAYGLNEYGLFHNTHFTAIDFTNVSTSHVTNMFTMFCGCKAKALNLSNFDTHNVVVMQGMFADCAAEYLDLRSFDTYYVRAMGTMFAGCQAATIDLGEDFYFPEENGDSFVENLTYECKAIFYHPFASFIKQSTSRYHARFRQYRKEKH